MCQNPLIRYSKGSWFQWWWASRRPRLQDRLHSVRCMFLARICIGPWQARLSTHSHLSLLHVVLCRTRLFPSLFRSYHWSCTGFYKAPCAHKQWGQNSKLRSVRGFQVTHFMQSYVVMVCRGNLESCPKRSYLQTKFTCMIEQGLLGVGNFILDGP